MKTIKIQFSGVWDDFDPEKLCLYQILKKYYDVQITDDPDYIICSSFHFYEYIDRPQIRIFFSGENYIPDFNHVDYAVSSYPIEFMDRHFSFPGLVDGVDIFWELAAKDRNYPNSILENKPYFANFISSHDSEHGIRSELFRVLSQYRRVESPGPFLYNMPNGEKVSREDGTKREFQKKSKFTLCCESTDHTGFITEKILEAFAADTIPIYYGSSTITDMINKEAFINLADYDTMEAAAEHIIQLDQDDEQYLRMLRQPIFCQSNFVETKVQELESFLCHIFDQPLTSAGRRSKVYMPYEYEKALITSHQQYQKELLVRQKQISKRKQRDRYIDAVLGRVNVIGNAVFGEDTFKVLKEKIKKVM